jgi:Sulfotransferase family
VDRFVVGTGRCGSTLLSRMLSQHPALLSIFEFFNGIDAGRRFADEPIDGKDFAALFCAEQPFVTAVLRRGYEVPEIVYPFGAGGRYRRDEPLPWVLVTALSRMTDDPDALYEEVVGFARALPRQPAVAHYRALFAWLAARRGRRIWLERSGSSIEYLAELARAFPGARFLHLHRDGRETALSMREHHAYRLPISILYGAPVDSGRTLAELGPIDVHAPPLGDDPVSQILASRPPARYFGAYWQDQVVRGHRALRDLDADQYAEVAFEDLVAAPREALGAIAEFFELPRGGDWIERAAALVRGAPAGRFDALPEPERSELSAACRAGMQLLGRER